MNVLEFPYEILMEDIRRVRWRRHKAVNHVTVYGINDKITPLVSNVRIFGPQLYSINERNITTCLKVTNDLLIKPEKRN
jgi:hypothetical protein